MMTPLVVGLGNPHRGDDAIGPVVAATVAADPRAAGWEVVAPGGDVVDLVLRWADRPVVVVDAAVTGGQVGRILRVDALATGVGCPSGPVSSHGLGLDEAIALGQALGRSPRSLIVLAVEGAGFEHLEPLSAAVAAAVPTVVDAIVEQLRACGDVGLDQAPFPAAWSAVN